MEHCAASLQQLILFLEFVPFVYFSNDRLPESESRSQSASVTRFLFFFLHRDGHIPRKAGCQRRRCEYSSGCYADCSSGCFAVCTGTVDWKRPGLHVVSASLQRSVVWGTAPISLGYDNITLHYIIVEFFFSHFHIL